MTKIALVLFSLCLLQVALAYPASDSKNKKKTFGLNKPSWWPQGQAANPPAAPASRKKRSVEDDVPAVRSFFQTGVNSDPGNTHNPFASFAQYFPGHGGNSSPQQASAPQSSFASPNAFAPQSAFAGFTQQQQTPSINQFPGFSMIQPQQSNDGFRNGFQQMPLTSESITFPEPSFASAGAFSSYVPQSASPAASWQSTAGWNNVFENIGSKFSVK